MIDFLEVKSNLIETQNELASRRHECQITKTRLTSTKKFNISLIETVKGLEVENTKNEELKVTLDMVIKLERENKPFKIRKEKISALEKSLEEKVKIYSDQIKKSIESEDVLKTRICSLD